MSDTQGKVIECQAAIAWEAGKPLKVEEVLVDPPKAGEVRVKILYTGVCHTDAYTLSGGDPEGTFPSILGHEGGGVVESVGPQVENIKVGDHVIPLYTPECGKCQYCKSTKSNLCNAIRDTQGKGVMPDGTSRFRSKRTGETLYHFMGCSTFAQYTVLPEIALAVVKKESRLDRVCLLGCGITTGVGAATVTANVQKGDTVAVFGAGTVGLSVVQGAKSRGAGKIWVIDIDDKKQDWAKQFGATDFKNPKKWDGNKDETLVQHMIKETDGGFDFTFDCTGNTDVMRQALEAAHRGWGQSIIIGVAAAGKEISTRPFQLVTGRVWKGSAFGGVKGRSQLPKFVDDYEKGTLKVDEFVTAERPLADINTAFEDLHGGLSLRTVVNMQEP